MRSKWFLVLGFILALGATAQPYAPEYMHEDPSWFEDMLRAARETPETSRAAGTDRQRKIDAIALEMDAAEARRREDAAAPRETPDYVLSAGDYVRVFVWLCVIVAAIILLGAALRRWGKKTPLLAGTSLGKVLGRVYLDRNVSLHFVETAGQVLVVGVAQGHISLLATYDKAALSGAESESATPSTQGSNEPKGFRDQLEATAARMRAGVRGEPADAEIQALRADIARLQRELREEAREFSE